MLTVKHVSRQSATLYYILGITMTSFPVYVKTKEVTKCGATRKGLLGGHDRHWQGGKLASLFTID